MKPKLRFPEFSGEWIEKRLEEIGEIVTGTTPSTKIKSYYENGMYPWITPTDINENKNIFESERKLTTDGLKKSRFIPKNSLLVTCIASIGKNAILRIDGSCNQQINALIPKSNYDIDFLYYLIETEKMKYKMLKLAGQTATPIINKREFSQIQIYFPQSLEEQQKIATFLSSVDEKIDIVSKKIEKLKEYKKGLMQKLLNVKNKEPELRFPEFSGEWVEKKLGELGETYSGLTNKNKEHFNKGNDYYIPFMNVMSNITIDNSFLQKVIINSRENQNKVQKGDILFTASSETPHEVGMCSVFLGNKKVYLNSFCFGYRLKISNVNNLYLAYLLRYRRDIFYKLAQGATRYNLSKKHFNEIKIYLPPTFEEQQKIANFLSAIDEKIELDEKKLLKLKKYKKGLLQKLFV